ncbi:unnamed protein product [Lupinus luteus]|uniref:Uncharacterized protein n=1 Tax=Lupinus luteus TaxID=3873 RepID=A0AAV1WWM8_LUPLU
MASLTASSSDLTDSFIATSFGPSSPKDNRTRTFTFPMNTPDNKHVCDLQYTLSPIDEIIFRKSLLQLHNLYSQRTISNNINYRQQRDTSWTMQEFFRISINRGEY